MNIKYYIKKILKATAAPFLWCIYFLSGFWYRRKDIEIYGATSGSFSDNSKYHFLISLNFDDGVRRIWISPNQSTVNAINKKYGRVAFNKYSGVGIYYQIVAKNYFFNCYVSDINFWLCRGATKINLWHGFPLKKIEYDIDKGELARVYNPKSNMDRYIKLMRYLINPAFLTAPNFIYNNKEGYDKIFISAFRINPKKFMRLESPRVSYLKNSTNKRYENRGNILYLPTMRESYTKNWLEDVSLINFYDLNKTLEKQFRRMDIKLHPNEHTKFKSKFSNLKILESDVDVYEILNHYDLLITDYSSIAFDAAEINMPIILYWPDHEGYMETTRGFYFDLENIFGNKIVNNLKDLSFLMRNNMLEEKYVNGEINSILAGAYASTIN
jgi:CDP-glycerol glycerophosphotransferase (TagB/SpsB family)